MEPLVRVPKDLLDGSSEPLSGDIVVGVDGGGTKTVAAAYDRARGTVTLGKGGPSNPDAVGDKQATESLEQAVLDAIESDRSGGDVAAAVFAVAGTDTDALDRTVDGAFDYLRPFVVNDVVAAWGAATGCRPGVAAICGTGSNIFGVGYDGSSWRAGGWGHILGDEGSGYWLGVQGINAALAVRDASGPSTALFDAAPEHFGVASVEALAALTYAKPFTKGEIASFARVVAERGADGDEVAGAILARAGTLLAAQARAVVSHTGLADADSFVLGKVGSTWKAGPLLNDAFDDAVRGTAPGAQFDLIETPPVHGALLLAGRAAGFWRDDPPTDLPSLVGGALERAG
jgi:N-acetylglucosamine kinase-like BadF-type ATPase